MHSTMESTNCFQDSDCDSDGDVLMQLKPDIAIQAMTAMMKTVMFFLMLQKSVME